MTEKNDIEYIELPTINDDCSLSVAENSKLPFAIKRIYYIYKPLSNVARGFHAHKKTRQILFCLSGSVRMVLESKKGTSECILNQPSKGVLLDAMVWHEMHDMDENTILLILASHEYDETDYIRNYSDFKSFH